jgi:hypothetical protein
MARVVTYIYKPRAFATRLTIRYALKISAPTTRLYPFASDQWYFLSNIVDR